MLDERSGAIVWQRQLVAAMHWMQSIGTPALIYEQPAIDGDTLFIAGRGELWAYGLKE